MEEVKNYYGGRHFISMEEGTSLVWRKAVTSLNSNEYLLVTNRGYSVTVDDRLTRTLHLSEVKKNLANKFLSKSVLEQFTFNVILPWLLNQLDTKKGTGLDIISCKLLKISTSIVGPSLAHIF